jgi:hypothetical protein
MGRNLERSGYKKQISRTQLLAKPKESSKCLSGDICRSTAVKISEQRKLWEEEKKKRR